MQAQKRNLIEYEPDPNKFDLRTHIWDTKGNLVKENTYRSFIREGRQVFERPVGSGNLWYENNEPAGRIECQYNEKGHIIAKEFKPEAKHIEFVPPMNDDEKTYFELQNANKRLAQLEAELASIKKEQENRTTAGKSENPEVKVKGK